MSRRIAKEIKEKIISKVQAGERVADLAETALEMPPPIYTAATSQTSVFRNWVIDKKTLLQSALRIVP